MSQDFRLLVPSVNYSNHFWNVHTLKTLQDISYRLCINYYMFQSKNLAGPQSCFPDLHLPQDTDLTLKVVGGERSEGSFS